MRDKQRMSERTLKIELLSQWKLEAEFRNCTKKVSDQLLNTLFLLPNLFQVIFMCKDRKKSHRRTDFLIVWFGPQIGATT